MTETSPPLETTLTIDGGEYFDAKIAQFNEINIHEDVIRAIEANGWTNPTPVQSLCLPFTTVGRHVAGFAQTGTGKTGVFLITILNSIVKGRANGEAQTPGPKALILVPTRELAIQICNDAEQLTKDLNVSFLAVFGGVDYDKQAKRLKDGVDVIVATPGRLKDYFNKKIVDLSFVQQFVCDEADRMFDMGFIDDVEFFLSALSDDAQKLLFSATTNEQVKELAFEYLEKPEYISVNPEVITPENIVQECVISESEHKVKVLLGLMRDEAPTCSIIFVNTKLVADWLHYKITKNGFEADIITGDLPQKKRIALIKKIKNGEIKALIATDVASRGLHISDVSHVFNFDLPDEPANYIHRIGRTARAGAKGKAFSFVCEDYGHNFEGIKKILGDIELPCVWPKSDYLSIEDISGNPFSDPEFKSASLREPAGRPDRKKPGERGERSERGERGERAPRGERSERPERAGGERSDRSGGERSDRGGERGGDRGRSRDRNRRPERPSHERGSQDSRQGGRHDGGRHRTRPEGQDRHDRHGSQKLPHDKKMAAAPAKQESTQTVGGLFKRIVSAIFGKKKS